LRNNKTYFKFRINVNDKIIHVQLDDCINEKEIKRLIKNLKKLEANYNFYKFIIVLPKKLKWTEKTKETLMKFIKRHDIIVSHSPIQRALFKTETIFAGGNTDLVCKSEMEALNKISQVQ